MRIILWIAVVIPCSLCGQILTTVTTYKAVSDKQLIKESIFFAYNFDKETFHMKENNLGTFTTFNHVEFYDEDFDDGGYYTLTFSSNLADHILNENEEGDIGVFAVFFDKKGGTILGVRVHKLNHHIQIYLTPEGMEEFTSG